VDGGTDLFFGVKQQHGHAIRTAHGKEKILGLAHQAVHPEVEFRLHRAHSAVGIVHGQAVGGMGLVGAAHVPKGKAKLFRRDTVVLHDVFLGVGDLPHPGSEVPPAENPFTHPADTGGEKVLCPCGGQKR
jgi:hypothetical protein